MICDNSPNMPVEAFYQPYNRHRNRYNNILCCELAGDLRMRTCAHTRFSPSIKQQTHECTHFFHAVDHSRVRLESLDLPGCGGDYINANFIAVSASCLFLCIISSMVTNSTFKLTSSSKSMNCINCKLYYRSSGNFRL